VVLVILLQMAPVARSMQMMDKVKTNYGTPTKFDGKEVTLCRGRTIALKERLMEKPGLATGKAACRLPAFGRASSVVKRTFGNAKRRL
jgi:hypothetical protein